MNIVCRFVKIVQAVRGNTVRLDEGDRLKHICLRRSVI